MKKNVQGFRGAIQGLNRGFYAYGEFELSQNCLNDDLTNYILGLNFMKEFTLSEDFFVGKIGKRLYWGLLSCNFDGVVYDIKYSWNFLRN